MDSAFFIFENFDRRRSGSPRTALRASALKKSSAFLCSRAIYSKSYILAVFDIFFITRFLCDFTQNSAFSF
jgi:hypothetical protein|nr:MAG TPA: hypothetical protein [Caudoviricetes sp.]